MKTKAFLACLLGCALFGHARAETEQDTRYLVFQIFTYGPNLLTPTMGEGPSPQPARFPDKAPLRAYIEDIRGRIGTVGDPQTRLGVMLGTLSFDHSDAETTKFIELAFNLALETDVAVGFHIDDSMFWGSRKDLLSNPENIEALDWDGTPCTGRLLNWGKQPTFCAPQMCFNSKPIQREVQQRAAVIGKAIQAGVNRLKQLKRPELFAGAIAGSETEIGQDFKTGKYLGYRALLNRGFSREHPPKDMDGEREKVVQEFIELWSKGLADAGVDPRKIYSHTCFLSHRAFGGDDKDITYMKRKGEITYSQHNHFAPPWVAFGKYHRPGFSTYPQGGIYEDIYEELSRHQQVGWASCEGTNMQPASGPGQTGMNMETYLAKMFNHGATLCNVQSRGIGGPTMRNLGFRVVTEGEEALQAYRKFLKGTPLIEGQTVASLMDRLPPKIHQVQKDLSSWMHKAGHVNHAAEAAALMQKMQDQLKAKNFDEVERTADSLLKMMGVVTQDSAQRSESTPQQTPPSSPPSDDTTKRLTAKVERIKEGARQRAASGRDPSSIGRMMEEKFKPLMEAGKLVEAEAELDRVLELLTPAAEKKPTTGSSAQAFPRDIPEEVREKLAHNIGCSFLLFRDKVQEELKVTREQKQKLEQHLATLLPEALEVAHNNKGRDSYNQKTHEEMARVLKAILDEGQRTRLHQLELQKDGLFGPRWNLNELQITDEQQKQFMASIQETQKKTQALMEEIHKGASPDVIRPKAFQLRVDLEAKLESLLPEAQKRQWKEMLGKPVNPGVLYGGL